jgi:uncharacterized membrane protein (DUF106 family)
MKKMTFAWIILLISMIIASAWDKTAWIKNGIHFILDPTAGAVLNWNLTIGMLFIVFILSLIITVIQKYTTDQKALKELKEEQKKLQKEMKEARNDPQKMTDLNKRNMEMMPKQFKLGMGSIAYTAIPFVLFFRWFNDYFVALGSPKFFGFLGWFWFYFIFSLIFSMILKKYMKVA